MYEMYAKLIYRLAIPESSHVGVNGIISACGSAYVDSLSAIGVHFRK